MAVRGPIELDRVEGLAPDQDEPSPMALAAIEAEWPLISAEVDLVDAECRVIADPNDVLALRARRRAVNALLALLVQRANHGSPVTFASTSKINCIDLHSAEHRPEVA